MVKEEKRSKQQTLFLKGVIDDENRSVEHEENVDQDRAKGINQQEKSSNKEAILPLSRSSRLRREPK